MCSSVPDVIEKPREASVLTRTHPSPETNLDPKHIPRNTKTAQLLATYLLELSVDLCHQKQTSCSDVLSKFQMVKTSQKMKKYYVQKHQNSKDFFRMTNKASWIWRNLQGSLTVSQTNRDQQPWNNLKHLDQRHINTQYVWILMN